MSGMLLIYRVQLVGDPYGGQTGSALSGLRVFQPEPLDHVVVTGVPWLILVGRGFRDKDP